MQRSIVTVLLQTMICTGVTGLCLWAMIRPKHMHHFLNENFHILPPLRPRSIMTPNFVRCFGLLLLTYAYSLLKNFRHELLWSLDCSADWPAM